METKGNIIVLQSLLDEEALEYLVNFFLMLHEIERGLTPDERGEIFGDKKIGASKAAPSQEMEPEDN